MEVAPREAAVEVVAAVAGDALRTNWSAFEVCFRAGFDLRDMTSLGMRSFLGLLLASLSFHLLAPASTTAEDLPVVHSDDFSKGMEKWTATDEKAWKISDLDGNPVLENLGGSKYEPPYRSPKNIILLDDIVVGDFELTARVQTTKESYGHRDMCLFFGYQDPSNFYYIHLGQKTDAHANQIFLVKEAPRVAISEKTTEGTPWKDKTWHDVKIVRRVADGLIEVYFDDMETPTHVAHDKSFTWGQVGLGTFDDKGVWDDFQLKGTLVSSPRSAKADPKQLQFEKWTPNFQVPDPVALSFDPQGRAYVTQTMRRKANDLDIRPNNDWTKNDLSFRSTDDKIAFYKKQFTPENSKANAKRVKDYNSDGIHDIQDLTALTEKVHLIADTDGDGLADTISTYAEDLDHLIGGVAGGVLFHEGDVYVSPVPEMVRFRDTDGDDKADEKTVMASGFGVHIAYAGHDMHGLFVGPDGRIYWSIGDKGIRVKTDDGLDYRFPSQGGLMRCEPDGSNFEIYAHGQRNIQEISFDQFGNFFGVDNDADYPGERERLVWVEQYLDTGWRSNWQYLRDRYNPWIHDLMHEPWHEDQPRWFTPPLSNYENGPAGFKFNPGTALSVDYQNYFFLTSAPRGEQWAFQVKPKGDSFEMIHDHKIGQGTALVGLNFAPDGALYGVDWGGGYPLNQKGAVWRIDVPGKLAHPDRENTQAFLESDFSKIERERFVTLSALLLRHTDQRVRLKAQWELAKRDARAELQSFAEDTAFDQLGRIHAIWGLGQLLRRGEASSEDFLTLFQDADPEIRAQAIRTVSDPLGRRLGLDRIPSPPGESHSLTEPLIASLKDPSQRVRIQALLALGRVGDPAASDAILALLGRKEHDVSMAYLRHAGVIALAGAVPTETITKLNNHKSDFVRACAVIALRKRGDAAVVEFLGDKDPITAADAARAIHDGWMIPEAMLPLAEAIGLHPQNEAFTRRAINANFRLGDLTSAKRVAQFVGTGEAPDAILAAGMEALHHWSKPDVIDLVVGRYRELEPRDPAIVAEAVQSELKSLLSSNSSIVRSGSMELARDSKLPIGNDILETVVRNTDARSELRCEALRTLASQEGEQLAELVDAMCQDKDSQMQKTALEILSTLSTDKALAEIESRLAGKTSLEVRQHAIRQLPAVGGEKPIGELVAELVSGKLDPALQLDVLETAKASEFASVATLAEPIQKWETGLQAKMATDPTSAFPFALAGGNAERGKSVFMNHAAAQCIRCHKVADGKGSDVGPNLKKIGKDKDVAYLLESLVDPQKVVTKGYGNISLTLKDGSSVAGQFRKEEKGHVVLRDPEGKESKIPIEKIQEKSPVVSTMPPMGFILNKGELRDVVAYLKSLKG